MSVEGLQPSPFSGSLPVFSGMGSLAFSFTRVKAYSLGLSGVEPKRPLYLALCEAERFIGSLGSSRSVRMADRECSFPAASPAIPRRKLLHPRAQAQRGQEPGTRVTAGEHFPSALLLRLLGHYVDGAARRIGPHQRRRESLRDLDLRDVGGRNLAEVQCPVVGIVHQDSVYVERDLEVAETVNRYLYLVPAGVLCVTETPGMFSIAWAALMLFSDWSNTAY